MVSSFGNTSVNVYGQWATSDLHHTILIELLAIVGVIVAVAGYRFIKLAMFLAGCALGFAVVYVFSPSFIHTKYCCSKYDKNGVHIIISFLSGVIAGALVSRLYNIGLFFIGKCFGLLMAVLILHTPMGAYFDGITSIGSFLATTSVVIGSLTIKYEKLFVTASTSFFGTYAALCGVDIFVKSPFSAAIYSITDYLKDAISYGLSSNLQDKKVSLPHYKVKANWQSRNGIIMFVSWILLSVICCLIQLTLTAKDLTDGGHVLPCDLSFKRVKEQCFGRKKEDRETAYFHLDGEKWRGVAK